MQNNTTRNITTGSPVNERDSSFGSNVRGFNKPAGNAKGYKPSSEFSGDKSFGPSAQAADGEGMTTAGNFDGRHVNTTTPENATPGYKPSSEYSANKSFGTSHDGNSPTGELSGNMNAPVV